MSIEELKKDSEEISKLLEISTRSRVKDALSHLKAEIGREINVLGLKAQIAAEKTTPTNKRYLVELTEYAWDQSEKFVKIFVTLEGVQNVNDDSVTATFTENSMHLLVSDLNGKDYTLIINNLLLPIDIEKSYRKVKTGLVAIYMKKKAEGQNWSHLTTIEKRVKDKQAEDIKPDMGAGGEDALVNIMKKMYNSGDTKTKQMIAKAWVESQEKARTGIDPNKELMDM